MGSHSDATAQPDNSLVRWLLLIAGVLLIIVGGIAAVFFVGMLFFSGIDLTEEIGGTGEGAGGAIIGLATVSAMLIVFGWSLVRPDTPIGPRKTVTVPKSADARDLNGRQFDSAAVADFPLFAVRGQSAPAIPRSPRVGTGILISAAVLTAADVASLVHTLSTDNTDGIVWMFLIGLAQIGLGIVGLVLSRTAERGRRRRYWFAGWISAFGNPVTVTMLLGVAGLIRRALVVE